jgi:hypothetical protein
MASHGQNVGSLHRHKLRSGLCRASTLFFTSVGIDQFERVLADRQASERQRLEALKYLVHFIGDVHQPLHASNNHDRGGNEVPVT